MTGPELTHWTIRLSLLCFAMALLLICGKRPGDLFRWFRLLWTAGCLLFLLHVVCAFAFFYHWSHSFAVTETAAKTKALIGVEFGRGIWFSYLFALLWLLDCGWTWLAPQSYQQRSHWVATLIFGYLCFIAFQGSVVFERGMVQPLGLLASSLLLGCYLWNTRRRTAQNP